MNKRDQIVIRRQKLIEFLGAKEFEYGCAWPMDKIMVALNCTKQQLRTDINALLENNTVRSTESTKGKKRTRTLYSNVRSTYVIPPIVKTKVYSEHPISAFDADKNTLLNGFTAKQFFGKWKYRYTIEKQPGEVKRNQLDPNCSIEAKQIALLNDLESMTNKEVKAKYGNKKLSKRILIESITSDDVEW